MVMFMSFVWDGADSSLDLKLEYKYNINCHCVSIKWKILYSFMIESGWWPQYATCHVTRVPVRLLCNYVCCVNHPLTRALGHFIHPRITISSVINNTRTGQTAARQQCRCYFPFYILYNSITTLGFALQRRRRRCIFILIEPWNILTSDLKLKLN